MGRAVFHILDKPLLKGDKAAYMGKTVKGYVDLNRRKILRSHHTATHIVFAACR